MLPDCVFLDGVWCCDMHPFVVNEATKTMVLDNICGCLNNFLKCPSIQNIVFCWVMHEQSIIDEILSRLALESCRVVPISLTCTEEALRSRLQKDIAEGRRTPDILDRSPTRLPLYEKLDTVKIDTSGKTAQQIVRHILEQ